MKISRGGPGNRKEPRMRMDDSGTEDSGEKVPGQKKARRLLKETAANDAAMVANHAAIAAEQAVYTERARLHQVSVDTELGRIAADNHRAEVELLKDDRRIMELDLSGMSATRVAYFENELVAIAKRQIDRAQRLEQDEEAARIAAEVAKAAAIEAVFAAFVEAARLARAAAAAAAAAVSADSVAATAAANVVDAADRANAARLVRAAAGSHYEQGESSTPHVESTDPPIELSDGDEGDDEEEETEDQTTLNIWADEVEAFAATRGEDEFPDDLDLGLDLYEDLGTNDNDSSPETSEDSM